MISETIIFGQILVFFLIVVVYYNTTMIVGYTLEFISTSNGLSVLCSGLCSSTHTVLHQHTTKARSPLAPAYLSDWDGHCSIPHW